MKRFAAAVLATALLSLPACSSGSGGSSGSSASPEDLITVRVTNTMGDLFSLSYTFARTPASSLGTVPRGAEGMEFTFQWEPGRLQFIVDLPQGVLSSNGVSAGRGDVFELNVGRMEARLTLVESAN